MVGTSPNLRYLFEFLKQNEGKKYHFAYTQCEAILSRTLLPNQDTPGVKAPYAIKVSVPSPYVAACSGQSVRDHPIIEDDGTLIINIDKI